MKYTLPIVVILLLFKVSIIISMETPSGSHFDENADPHFKNAVNALSRKINLKDYAVITDIECRDGKITAYMHSHASPKSSVTGKDSSLKNIINAQDQYRDRKQLLFRVMNIRAPNNEHTVNLLTCFQGAHLCPDKSIFFSRTAFMLKTNGTLLLTAPVKTFKTAALLTSLKKTAQNSKWQSLFSSTNFEKEYVPFESIDEIQLLLEKNDFSQIEIEVDEHMPRFQNAKSLAHYFAQELSVFHVFGSLAPEQKEQFSNMVTAEYLAQISSSLDGTIEFPQATVIVKANYHPYSFFSGSWPSALGNGKRHTP